MSKEAGVFFQKMVNNLVGGLNTVTIGTIEAFDATKAKADVKLLPGGELIVAVPVAMPQTGEFIIRLPYKKGDFVVVVFAQRDIDEIINGSNATATERMLSIDDAIVIGGVNLFTQTLPAEDADKLVIRQKSGSAKITMDATGAINIVGPNGVTITGKSLTESW